MKLGRVIAIVSLAAGAPRLAAAESRTQAVEVCRAVPEAESHLAALLSANDVLSVEELSTRDHITDPTAPIGDGARIVIRAHPFVTVEWLQRVIACHLARNAVMDKRQLATSSPLDVVGATAAVSKKEGTIVIDVMAIDPAAVRDIRARAQSLRAPR